MLNATPRDEQAIRAALSHPRSARYVAAARSDPGRGMILYGWNAQVSAALMLPAHFAEVVTRNAASDALAAVYGPNWPWNPTFELSLPAPRPKVYSPRHDLVSVRRSQMTPGKVIAELKFAFWQGLFTARHDARIWVPHLLAQFPNHRPSDTVRSLRGRIFSDLDEIRKLRNRIAHHEPVFSRNLQVDLDRMLVLIELRSAPTADWVRSLESVTPLLANRP